MLIGNAGIIHYVLFWNRNNGLQCTYFVNNGLQSASVNRHFLNIIHKMVQIWRQLFIIHYRERTRVDVETCEPQTQELSVSSVADSLSLNFLVFLVEMSRYFSMKTKEKLGNANWVKEFSCRFLQNVFSNRQYVSSKCISDWELPDITVHKVN